MKHMNIAILGAGNMGSSFLGGLIANHYPAEKIWITDTMSEKLDALKKQFHIHTTIDNNSAVQNADIVILAVKPNTLAAISQDIAKTVQTKNPLIISIAAGVRINSLQGWLGKNTAIVRAMPNTPALIGCGATALFANELVTKAQRDAAESIMSAVGISVWVQDEKLMDVITALSGSGPAYFFLVIEAMQNAAVELGLSSETARLLTLQTAHGAARMAVESDVDVVELRRRVTSPGGTTERAVQTLEMHKIRDIFKNALLNAKIRSEELAEMN